MPNNETHCIFTARKYGIRGEDLHRWIDKPSNLFGIYHRKYRHNYELWIPDHFLNKYGIELAKAIARSHIWLDNNWHWYKVEFY